VDEEITNIDAHLDAAILLFVDRSMHDLATKGFLLNSATADMVAIAVGTALTTRVREIAEAWLANRKAVDGATTPS
jgi:hypothetical protein